MDQIDSWRSKECIERAAENSNFDILLCKTPRFRCKSRCTEDLKWLFLDSILLVMCKSQHSSTKLNVVFFKIHWNSQKTRIRDFSRVKLDHFTSDFGFLRIPIYFKEYHIELRTRILTSTHEKMYEITKQSFQDLCTARFALEN